MKELVNGVDHLVNVVSKSHTLSHYAANDSSLFNHYVFFLLLGQLWEAQKVKQVSVVRVGPEVTGSRLCLVC